MACAKNSYAAGLVSSLLILTAVGHLLIFQLRRGPERADLTLFLTLVLLDGASATRMVWRAWNGIRPPPRVSLPMRMLDWAIVVALILVLVRTA